MTRIPLLCWALLWPGASMALEPDIRWEHEETYRQSQENVAIRFPGDAESCSVRAGDFDGDMYHHVFEISETVTTLDIMADVGRQLRGQGFLPVMQCSGAECGGFDFLRCMVPPPPPEMFVDLADFRFLATLREEANGPAMAMALASRSRDRVFLEFREARPTGHQRPPIRRPEAAISESEPLSLTDSLIVNGYAVLEGLVFKSGSPELGDAAQATLTELATFLKNNPARQAVLVGHTDAHGPLANNLDLSQRRARSVYRQLIDTHGVDPARLSTEGIGYLAPRGENRTQDGRVRNRRVEVIILPQR